MEEARLLGEVGRRTGKSGARQARREGKVPAVVYGLGTEPLAVAVPGRELSHILSGPGGANTLINLDLGSERELVLARQVQRHPVRHSLVHVDLVRVRRDTAVAAEVPLHLVGEAPGVRVGGLLEQVLFMLSVEAKPADLPAALRVDISSLRLGEHLSVADIELPPGVVTTHDPEEQIVHVSQPRGLALPGEEAEAGEAPEVGGTEGRSAEARGES